MIRTIAIGATLTVLGGCAQTSYTAAEIAQIQADIIRKCSVNRDAWVREMCQDHYAELKIAEVERERENQRRMAQVGMAVAEGMKEYGRRQEELAREMARNRPVHTTCLKTGSLISCNSF